MPSRRRLLRGAALGALAVSGCLERAPDPKSDAPSGTGGGDAGTEPGDTTPRTQFQYDAQHTGVSDAPAPERIERRWRSQVSPIEGGLAVADGLALVAVDGSLVALDTDDGEERWTADVGQSTAAAPAMTTDTAYVPAWNGGDSTDRGVAAIDLADGSERWRAIPGVDVSSGVTLANDTVYAGGSLNSAHVIALDAEDGSERWRFRAGQYAPPPSVSGGVAYVGGGEEHVAYALDAADGGERWRVDVDGPAWGSPTVVDDTVYVGTREGTVYALSAADGGELWRVRVGDDVRESLAATTDTVYVPDMESVHALSTDGETLWSVDVRGFAYAPTVAGDSIVVTDRREAFCLDAVTGTERWRQEVRSRGISDMMFVGIRREPVVHDGIVYVASDGGDVYALQPPA